jgi:hypothetical protein
MITGGKIPSIDEMTTDEYGLRSTTDIDPEDLRMSSSQWELQGLMPSGKALDHVSIYGTDLSDEVNAGNMNQMFVNLPAEVITKGVSRIHEEFSKFFRTEVLRRRIKEQKWTFCFVAWDSTMFYRYSESLC